MGAISLMGEGSRENAAARKCEYRCFSRFSYKVEQKNREGDRRKKVKETLLGTWGTQASLSC